MIVPTGSSTHVSAAEADTVTHVVTQARVSYCWINPRRGVGMDSRSTRRLGTYTTFAYIFSPTIALQRASANIVAGRCLRACRNNPILPLVGVRHVL